MRFGLSWLRTAVGGRCRPLVGKWYCNWAIGVCALVVFSLVLVHTWFLLSADLTLGLGGGLAGIGTGAPVTLERDEFFSLFPAPTTANNEAQAVTRNPSNPYEVGIVPLGEFWAQDGCYFAWPPTVRMPCRHPDHVRVCQAPRKRMIILFWSEKLFDMCEFVRLTPKDKLSHFGCCDGIDMIYTTDRKYFKEAAIVEFFARHLPAKLPERAHPYQLFMMSSGEGPYGVERPDIMGSINLLKTFSSRFDILNNMQQPGECFCEKYLQPLKISYNQRHEVPIGALVSNCETVGGREDLLRYFIENTRVHSFGSCFNNFKAKEGDPRDATANYLYYFAVESAICTDYITEKFSRSLSLGTVPIVLSHKGVPAYGNSAPNEFAYVDLSLFEDLNGAIDFIEKTARSEDAYAKHHMYRGQPMNSSLISDAFRKNLCADKQDDLKDYCRLAQKLETADGREELIQKTYGNYEETMARQCATNGIMKTFIPKQKWQRVKEQRRRALSDSSTAVRVWTRTTHLPLCLLVTVCFTLLHLP